MKITRWKVGWGAGDDLLDELVVEDVECVHAERLDANKVYVGLWDGHDLVQLYFTAKDGVLDYVAYPEFEDPALNSPKVIPSKEGVIDGE